MLVNNSWGKCILKFHVFPPCTCWILHRPGVVIPSLLFSKRRGGSQITPTFLATPQNANASRDNFVMNLNLDSLWGLFKKKSSHIFALPKYWTKFEKGYNFNIALQP